MGAGYGETLTGNKLHGPARERESGDAGTTPIGRVVIVNAYSYHNAGDAAIMLSTRDMLLDLGAEAVALSTRYPDSEDYFRHGVKVIPEIIPFPTRSSGRNGRRAFTSVAALVGAVLIVQLAQLWPSAAKSLGSRLYPEVKKIMTSFDSLAIAGGGYMYSSRRWLNLSLWHSLATIRFVQVFVPRTVMLPQSIGPLNRRFDSAMVAWALRETLPVQRETLSLKSSSHRPRSFRTEVVDDIAFYGLRVASADSARRTADVRAVRVVAMDWRWSTSVAPGRFDAYLDGLAAVCDQLAEEGYEVVLGGHSAIPEHNQDDVEIARLVADRTAQKVSVDPNCDVAHLNEEYRSAALVIGTRLHACIMALAVGTPAIAIAYQEKSIGVLGRVQLGAEVFWASKLDPAAVVAAARRLLQIPVEEMEYAGNSRKAALKAFYEGYVS
jgi:polysaccharide pyruvyl transferase WcaK-like protein